MRRAQPGRELLRQLASRPGRLFTRAQLIEGMYRDDRVVTERTVDTYVRRIRANVVMGMWHETHWLPLLPALWCVCPVACSTRAWWHGRQDAFAVASANL